MSPSLSEAKFVTDFHVCRGWLQFEHEALWTLGLQSERGGPNRTQRNRAPGYRPSSTAVHKAKPSNLSQKVFQSMHRTLLLTSPHADIIVARRLKTLKGTVW